MEIGKRIRQIRGEKSRKAFGQLIGIVENTLRNYEEGRAFPNSDVLAHICRIFSIDPFWLLLGDDEHTRSAGLKTGNEFPLPEGAEGGINEEPRRVVIDNYVKRPTADEWAEAQAKVKADLAACPRCVKLYERIIQSHEKESELLKENGELKAENKELKARLSLSTAAPVDSTRTNTA
jgi:transcriptional regulator with XRE-family HTH domain